MKTAIQDEDCTKTGSCHKSFVILSEAKGLCIAESNTQALRFAEDDK